MPVVYTMSAEEYRTPLYRSRRTTISSRGETERSSGRAISRKAPEVIAQQEAARIQSLAPEVEQQASIQSNMMTLRQNQPFSVDGEKYNSETKALEPKKFDTAEELTNYQTAHRAANKINRLVPERKEDFKEQTEKYSQPKQQYAPNATQKDFYTPKGQVQAIKRGAVAIHRAESDILNTATFGKYGQQSSFTVNTSNEKANLFIEKRVNNPMLAAAELTFLKGAGTATKRVALAVARRGTVKAATSATTIAAGRLASKQFVKRAVIQTAKTVSRTPGAISNVVGASSITQTTILSKSLNQKEAKALRSPALKQKYAQTLQLQAQEIGQKGGFIGGVQSIGFGITSFAGSKDQFANIASKQDLSTTEQSALMKMRTAGGTSEIVGLLGSGVAGEKAGRLAQKTLFNKVGKTGFSAGFTRGATAIAPAGFVEGSSGEFVQQFSRGETTNIKRVGAAGGVGTVSAGVLGGTITGFSATTKAGSRKLTEGLGNVLDPFEYPADKLTDFGSFASKGLRKTKSPTLSLSLSSSNSKGIGTNTAAFSKSPLNTPTTTKSFTSSKQNAFVNIPSQAPTPTNIFTPTTSFTNVPSPIPSQVPAQIPAQIPVNVNVPNQNFAYSNVPNINFRIPAAPIGSMLGGGGGGFNFHKRMPRVKKGFAKTPTVFSILAGKPTARK